VRVTPECSTAYSEKHKVLVFGASLVLISSGCVPSAYCIAQVESAEVAETVGVLMLLDPVDTQAVNVDRTNNVASAWVAGLGFKVNSLMQTD
jgi:hypothetical protein